MHGGHLAVPSLLYYSSGILLASVSYCFIIYYMTALNSLFSFTLIASGNHAIEGISWPGIKQTSSLNSLIYQIHWNHVPESSSLTWYGALKLLHSCSLRKRFWRNIVWEIHYIFLNENFIITSQNVEALWVLECCLTWQENSLWLKSLIILLLC